MDELTDPESARRIAVASDQRRRSMERAMHDGVQQHLALAALNISLLRSRLHSDPDGAEAICDELSGSLASAQRELRELAHWVYPVVLENDGLVAALTDAAHRQQAAIEIRAEGLGRHPAEIETVVYFCCLEALENVERFAAGVGATVTLHDRDHHLDFIVEDDGPGFDPAQINSGGLQHVADRLRAIGGQLEITSAPGQGTTVHGTVPLD